MRITRSPFSGKRYTEAEEGFVNGELTWSEAFTKKEANK